MSRLEREAIYLQGFQDAILLIKHYLANNGNNEKTLEKLNNILDYVEAIVNEHRIEIIKARLSIIR